MKTRKIFSTALILSVVAIMWSCSTTDEPIIDELESTFLIDNSLLATNSISDQLRDSGFGGPTAFIFGKFYNGKDAGRSDVNSPIQMMRGLKGNTNSARANDDIAVCMTETYTEFVDGSYKYVLDFGDGCQTEWGFMKGNLVETGSYTETTFEDHIEYFGFGGEDWEIDGTEDYEGTYSEAIFTTTDSVAWSTSYSFTSDLVERFIEFGYDELDTVDVSIGEQLIEVIFVANGLETMDQEGYLVESGNESYEVSTGESFTSTVDMPLYMDFTCDSDSNDEYIWVFVSGVESGTYSYPTGDGTDGLISGIYSIDYGDDTCDNIIVITENGVSEEIDLGEEWDDWEDDCGEDHDDSTTTNG